MLIYGAIVAVITIYFAIRIQWVFNTRLKWLYTNIAYYDAAPSFDYMMALFWIWNPDKFLKSSVPR